MSRRPRPTDPPGAPRAAAPESPPAHWLDQPRNVMRLWRGFLVVLALTVVAEFLVVMHPSFEAESLFAFPAMYGFFTCAAMIVVAKLLGRVLKRPDTYYEADDER